ncbi:MAG TPA: hypothetical protein PKO10_00290 [Aliarcobacter cryaerophilus]|nr:hypothetical protein [Aliarcobacter cryaerophilus]
MPLKTDDLFMQVNDTKSVTLQSGVAYTKGMLVTLQSNGKYTNGTVANPDDPTTFGRQVIGILVDDVNATSADRVGVIATDAVANLNKITFAPGQTLAHIAGTLQAKNLKLEGWNK